MILKIKIDQDILAKSAHCPSSGNPQKAMVGQKCAIACAIVNLFGKRSWVAGTRIFIFPEQPLFDQHGDLQPENVDYEIDLPEEAQDFINAFDYADPEERMQMKQLEFNIDVPNELINEIGIKQVSEILSKSRYMEEV
jgi:hypothetical protein